MQKAKKVLNHFGYNESQFDISDVYTGHRKKTVNEIFEKIAERTPGIGKVLFYPNGKPE